MRESSAGLVMVRLVDGRLEVLLAHPGGPYWVHKDDGAWTIPKGQRHDGEDALAAAQREFTEETGLVPHGPFHALGLAHYKSGKEVHAWAFTGDCDPSTLRSNTCQIEWPPRSGRRLEIPEIDRAAFFPLREARRKIVPAQWPLLERLAGPYPAEYERSAAATP